MANIFANYSFDQSNLDLNRLYANAFDFGLMDDAFLTYNGINYRDVYIVDWELNGFYASAFGGNNITTDFFENITGGTVNGYLELGWNGFEYVELWGIEDVTISARELYLAATTFTTDDEFTIIEQALSGPDNFILSDDADRVFGGGGNDFIVGNGGDDWLYGNQGNDTLIGGTGDDFLHGSSGFDIAAYSGNQNSYTLTLSASSNNIADRLFNGDGTDQLVDIELLDFADEDINLSQIGGNTSLSASEFESFIELYIAYFNRSPDAIGLNFWGTAFANGTTLEEMAALFVDQDETRATYPEGTSNSDFVTAVYDNVFGREFDQAGFDFWLDKLNRSAETGVTRDQFILEVLRGVQDGSPDRAYLDTKVDIGAYFAVHRGMSDTDNASAAMALFDGTREGVTDAVAAIDGYYQDALDPSNGEFLMQVVGVLDNPFG